MTPEQRPQRVARLLVKAMYLSAEASCNGRPEDGATAQDTVSQRLAAQRKRGKAAKGRKR